MDGGIRYSRGNQFFRFAPPTIVLKGGDDKVELYCNGQRLPYNQAGYIYELPEELLNKPELLIQACHSGKTIRRRSLYLIEDFPWVHRTPVKQFDCFGNGVSESNNGTAKYAGGLIWGINPSPFNFSSLVGIQEERRVFFVGRVPGQIVTWPKEPLPTGWSPVWAIPLRQRGQAVFCGTGLSGSEPLALKGNDRKKVKLWKEILWHCRKRISPPSHTGLRKLWVQFQEAARRV